MLRFKWPAPLGPRSACFPFFFRPLHERPPSLPPPFPPGEEIGGSGSVAGRGRRRGRGLPFRDMINYRFKPSTEHAPRPAEERPPCGAGRCASATFLAAKRGRYRQSHRAPCPGGCRGSFEFNQIPVCVPRAPSPFGKKFTAPTRQFSLPPR